MARAYVPEAGDIVWLNFTPHPAERGEPVESRLRAGAGREQADHRPALVLSPAAYNAKTSLMICCPLTTQIKNYPFEVVIAGAPPSVALSDQVKSVDWRVRKAERKGRATPAELAEVRAKLKALIG